MVPISLTNGNAFAWPTHGLGFKWYLALVQTPLWVQAAMSSLIVGFCSSLLAMLIGTPAAFVIARQQMRGKTAILAVVLSPLIIPRMIIAVALFYLYAKIELVGTYLGLVLGHTVLAIPYVVITVIAVLKNYDERYDQAAWSLGAARYATLRKITFPLIRGGLASAFLFAYITSFDELTIALFVTGGLKTTLPKQMWDGATLAVTPSLASISTLILVFVAMLIVIAARLQRKD